MDDRRLNHLWDQFRQNQNNRDALNDYLDEFCSINSDSIDIDFKELCSQKSACQPPLRRAIPDALQASIKRHLFTFVDEMVPDGYHRDGLTRVHSITEEDDEHAGRTLKTWTGEDWQRLKYVEMFTKLLIILSRNSQTINSVASSDFVRPVITICEAVLNKLYSKCEMDEEQERLLLSYVKHSLHYLECLYDPGFKWRLSLAEPKIEGSENSQNSMDLDMQIVPFIYECFQRQYLHVDIQMRLLHLFGGIISGSQTNSLKAICPATVDVLMEVLQNRVTEKSHNPAILMRLATLVLQCIVATIQTIHNAMPEERQVEIGAILESYFRILLKPCDNERHIFIKVAMLDATYRLLSISSDNSAMQNIFMATGVCKQLVTFIGESTAWSLHCQNLSIAVVRVIGKLLSNSTIAKENFAETVGYERLFEVLRILGQPSEKLLNSLLELVAEEIYDNDHNHLNVKNSFVAVMLVRWLTGIESHDVQSWLATSLYHLCTKDNWSLIQCFNDGMNAAILDCLEKRNVLDTKTVGDLLDLLESTGSLCISQNDLKQLFRLLKSEHSEVWLKKRLLNAMSKMAGPDNKQTPLTYLRFNSQEHGIVANNLGRWSGSGFTFHAWICLDDPSSIPGEYSSTRRQLYSIHTSSGCGFEAFFTCEAVLVVSVFTKKERNDIPVVDCRISYNKWHCLDVVHTSSKRPFSQSQLCVYVDEVLYISANLKFPANGEDIIICKIGCGNVTSSHMRSSGSHSNLSSPTELTKPFPTASLDRTKKSHRFWSRISKPFSSTSSLSSPVQPPDVENFHQGDGNEVRHGMVTCLFGQLSEVIIFMDSLLDTQVQSLYQLGPNRHLQQTKEGFVPGELPYKPLIMYHAKATLNDVCLDLSSNGHNAKVAGHLCSLGNIKDVINTVGGIQLLFVLLEEAAVPSNDSSQNLINLNSIESRHLNGLLDHDIETLQPFFVLLRSLVDGCHVNQEMLLYNDTVSSLGAILQKANSSLLDEHFHSSLKSFVDVLPRSAVDDTRLLYDVYEHLVFDFRIWSRCDFQVCNVHVQYIFAIIKEDRKYFRKKYGVQFILDTIRLVFGSSSLSECSLSNENKRTIRVSLLDVIRFYVGREINVTELSQILAFCSAVQEAVLVSEVLDVVKSLLEARGKRDQIYLLLFEPGMADMLYVLLTIKDFSVELKEKIFQIMALLLKTDRVYERNKSRLRLVDSNLFPGLVSLMVDTLPSVDMTKHMLEQVFIAESSASINAAIYIIQTLHLCDVDVKLEAIRQLMKVLLSKPSIPKLFASQGGWQIALVRLFVLRPAASNTARWRSSLDGSDAQQTVQRADTTSKTTTMDEKTAELVDVSYDSATNCDRNVEEDDDGVVNRFPLSRSFDPYALPDGKRARSSSGTSEDGLDGRSPTRSLSIYSDLSASFDNGMKTSISSYQVKEDDAGDSIVDVLKELGLTVNVGACVATDNVNKTEELCQNLLIVLYVVVWKGIEGADDSAWQQRGQVFAAINYTGEENEMLMSKTDLTRKLLELILQGCLVDIQDSGTSNPNNSKNALNIMKLLYQFLCIDIGVPSLKFSKQLLEDMMVILEDYSIWQMGNEWKEMEQMALRCLLAFAAQDNSDLCGIAAGRLHVLVQTRPVEKFQESCYIVGTIDDILDKSLEGNRDQYNFLIQVMKSLLEKCDDLLNIPCYLPNLPCPRNSITFMEDFRTYSQSEEWKSFIRKQVQPSKDQYLVNIYEGLLIQRTSFMGDCHEEMMVAGHKRNREKSEAKQKFEDDFVMAFKNCSKQENKRFKGFRLQLQNQNLAAWRQWKLTKSFSISERGLWPDKNTHPNYWNLSTNENYSRMRPKMIANEKFDTHVEASRLRDNEGPDEDGLPLSTLSLMNEVKATEAAGDDRLEDDDWLLISNTVSTTEPVSTKETILSEECELVTIMEVIKGRLDVTPTHIYFFDYTPSREDGGVMVDLKWLLDEIKEIHFRRHNLRRSALEFFLVDQTNYFINFQKKVRNKVYSRILSLRPPNLIYNQSRSPSELLKASGLTQKWIQREISNFDYLMCLNTIAGRTYNDLSQYPVFPWILSDYTSEKLDLNDPRSYRDLSRPIGIINPRNESQVQEKYEHFEDPTGIVAKFHYGTHYSNPAGVMHYLIRIEPFTTLHIQLQSGRFDVADRQFHSIPATWQGLMDNPNDVKELIPEFFYLPEFLVNMNDFDLGRLQFGEGRVDDVILPAWASSPYEFIHKHRLALESDHVSEHLQDWIDLIFGYKQQGPAAIDALNVFYYCSYEGAVDLDSVTDEKRRRAFEGMINNFGQTPCQLLKEPHPKRMTLMEIMTQKSKPERLLKVPQFPDRLNTFAVEASPPNDPLSFVSISRNHVSSFIAHWTMESMVAITESGTLFVHSWLPYDKNISGFFTFERDTSMNNIKTRKRLPGGMSPGLKVTSKMFSVSHDAKLVFSCGHWDNSLRVYSIVRSKQVAHIVRHRDIVTCLSLDTPSRRLISGSRDATCIIWEIVHQGGASHSINPQPLHVLCGHDDHVTCVAIATELDMAVSGSKDGTVIIHSVRHGTYLRTLRPPYEKGWQLNIQLVTLSCVGEICVYGQHTTRNANDKLSLHLYSINGKHLSKEIIQAPISDMIISGDYLVFGNVHGFLVIKELYSLCTLTNLQLHQPVTCVSATNEGSHILCALADSSLIVAAVKRP